MKLSKLIISAVSYFNCIWFSFSQCYSVMEILFANSEPPVKMLFLIQMHFLLLPTAHTCKQNLPFLNWGAHVHKLACITVVKQLCCAV